MAAIDLQSPLGQRMFQAVPAELRTRLLQDCAQYEGRVDIVAEFLDRGGTDNPYEAAENLVLKRHIFRPGKERIPTGRGKSVSGHTLTRQLFIFVNKYNPTITLESGSQAATRFFQRFGSPEKISVLRGEASDEQKQRRERQARATTAEIETTLEDILQDPTKIKDIRSRTEREQIHAALNITAEIKRLLQSFGDVAYGNTAFLDQRNPHCLIPLERGGLFRRLESKLEELPEVVRDFYTTLHNPAIDLPEERRKLMMGTLIAYDAITTHVDRDSAVGGYQQDLDFLLKLPDSHQFFQEGGLLKELGKPDLTPVRDILAQPEITLIDVTKVFSVYPINRVRRELNSRLYQEYKEDIEEILKKIRPLFIKDGEWREDCLADTIPLDRLKKTVYWSTLMREDFVPLRDLLRNKTLTLDQLERLYQATPIQEFKDLIEKAVIAQRKVRYMEKELPRRGFLYEDIENIPEIEKEQAGMLRGKEYDLLENFEQQYDISLPELIHRAETLHHGPLKQHWEAIKQIADVGLYQSSLFRDEIVQIFLEEIKSYLPFETVREKYHQVRELLSSPLIKTADPLVEVSEQIPYVHPTSVARIEGILAAAAEIKRIEEQYGENLEAILEQRQKIEGKVCYQGMITSTLSVTRKQLNDSSYTCELGGKEIGSPHKEGVKVTVGKVVIYDPDRLQQELTSLEDNYLPVENISEGWRIKTRSIIDRSTQGILKKIGLEEISSSTWKNVQNMKQGEYVSRELIQEMDGLYGKIDAAVSFRSDVVSSGQLAEDPLRQYSIVIRGTKPKDRDLFSSELSGFRWQEQKWQSSLVLAPVVKYVTEVIAEYNDAAGRILKVEIL